MKRKCMGILIKKKKRIRRSVFILEKEWRGEEGEINARSVTEKDRGVTYGRALFF